MTTETYPCITDVSVSTEHNVAAVQLSDGRNLDVRFAIEWQEDLPSAVLNAEDVAALAAASMHSESQIDEIVSERVETVVTE